MEDKPDVFDVIHAALEKGVRTWDEYVKRNRGRLEGAKMGEFDKQHFEECVENILTSAQEPFNPDDPECLFQFVRELEVFYNSMDGICAESILKLLGLEKTPTELREGT